MAQEQKTASEEKAQETTSVEVSQPQEQGKALERPSRGGLATTEWANPFATMRRLMNDMDRFLSGFGFGPSSSLFGPVTPFEMIERDVWTPAIETFEREGKLVLRTDLPGLRREDVNVEIIGNELVVSGERKQEKERTAGGRHYSERRYGSFERRLTLPEGIKEENIEASFDNGVLEVSLAVPGRETHKIEVKSGSSKKAEGGGQEGEVH